jgi:heat shock protein HslJ
MWWIARTGRGRTLLPPTVAALAVALGTGCAGTGRSPAGAPTWNELANATYDGILELPVRLTDGRWEGAPFVPGGASRPSLVLARPILGSADLDGNGAVEAVALLAESTGGSGTFQHVAVAGRRGNRIVSLASAPVGDRVQVRSARLSGNRIAVDVVQQGPNDPASAPTRKVTRTWVFASGELREEAAVDRGTISIRDLEGVVWVLDHFAWNEAAPADPAASLEFSDGSISGEAFCNRYFADVVESSPTELAVGKITMTKRACSPPVNVLEKRFLDALRNAKQYRFLAGRLAVVSESDGVLRTMLFTPVPGAGSTSGVP